MARMNYQKLAYDVRMSRQPVTSTGDDFFSPKSNPKKKSPIKGTERRAQEIRALKGKSNRNANQEKRLQCLLKLQAKEAK